MGKFICDYCYQQKENEERSIYVFDNDEDSVACKSCEEKAFAVNEQ